MDPSSEKKFILFPNPSLDESDVPSFKVATDWLKKVDLNKQKGKYYNVRKPKERKMEIKPLKEVIFRKGERVVVCDPKKLKKVISDMAKGERLEPVRVDGAGVIDNGHHRYIASILFGFNMIPVVVV